MHKETSEKDTQLADEKQKNKHQQEESRKLKIVIGKLKVTIKGKKDNKCLTEEITKLQREAEITKKELWLMEIKRAEHQAAQENKKPSSVKDFQMQTEEVAKDDTHVSQYDNRMVYTCLLYTSDAADE